MTKKDAEKITTVINSAYDGKFDADVNKLLSEGWNLLGNPRFNNDGGNGLWGVVALYKPKATAPPLKKTPDQFL